MKKLSVGDSVKFKDGRTGIVEDCTDTHYIVKDSNGNQVKIKMINDDENEVFTKINNFISELYEKFKSNASNVDKSGYFHKFDDGRVMFESIGVQWDTKLKYELDVFFDYSEKNPETFRIRFYINNTYTGDHAEETDSPNHAGYAIHISNIDKSTTVQGVYDLAEDLYENYIDSYKELYQSGENGFPEINEYVNKINFIHDDIVDIETKLKHLYVQIKSTVKSEENFKQSQVSKFFKELILKYEDLLKEHNKLAELISNDISWFDVDND